MININRIQNTDVDTGRHVLKAAVSLIQNGPEDAIDDIDKANERWQKNKKRKDKAEGDCSTGDCGCTDCGDSSSGNSGRSNSRPNSSRRSGFGVDINLLSALDLNGTIWESIICGFGTAAIGGRKAGRIVKASLWLRLLGCDAEDIFSLLKNKDEGFSLSSRAVQNRLNGVMGAASSRLSEKDRKRILDKLSGSSDKADEEQIRVSINGNQRNVSKDHDPEDVESLAQLMRKAASSRSSDDGPTVEEDRELAEALDREAELAVLDSMLESAVEMGIPDAFDLVAERTTDPKIRRRLFLPYARAAAINSDLVTLNKIIEYTSSDAVVNHTPSIIVDVVRYYRLPNDKDNDVALLELTDTLTLLDANWSITQRNQTDHSNLDVFAYASNDTRSLLKQVPEYLIPCMVSEPYRPRHYKQFMFNYYPRIA